MSDRTRILRIEKRTFADESFKIADRQGLVVLAQLPQWSELRWHKDLVQWCGADLKWARVRSHWRDLSPDLRRAVVRDLRDALITIVDPSAYRFDIEHTITAAVRKPKSAWPHQFRQLADTHIVTYEMRRVLFDSPATRIQAFLEDDGEVLGSLGGADGNTDGSQSILSQLEQELKNPHTVRLFGARSAAAFSHLLDRDGWIRMFTQQSEMGFFMTPGRVVGHLLAEGERTQRVFDEGNRPSVVAIARLKDAVRNRLVARGRIVPTDAMPAGALEQSSTDEPMLQAADLAGGYARMLYVDLGLRVVCEEFKGVILNGSMVRDWSQVERADLTELRHRK